MKIRNLKRMVQYLLLVLSVLMVITGLGIIEPGIIGLLTGGILGKMLSYRLHVFLWGPFVITLIIHVYFSQSGKT